MAKAGKIKEMVEDRLCERAGLYAQELRDRFVCVKELCGKSCVRVCEQAVCERLGVTKLCVRVCLKDCV